MSSKLTAFRVHVTKEEFDDFLYPAFVHIGSKDDAEAEIAVRIAKDFRQGPTVTETVTISDTEGGRSIGLLKLIVPDYTFIVESDMFNMLKNRYKKYMVQLRDAVIIEKMEFRDKLKDSEKIEIDSESAKAGAEQQASKE
jgi:hypothetical protein